MLREDGEPDSAGPYSVSLRRRHGPVHPEENDAGDTGWRCGAGHPGWETYVGGRVPLCSCCGHPWPCRAQDEERFAMVQMRRAERDLKLLPGCCPTCQEPVTSRQRTIDFPGEYVHNPLAPPDPVFHLRRKCVSGAADYEDAWVAADPTRARSLLTLRCEGTVIVHGDGSAECFGATDSDCPSVHARHRGYSACYLQSHGCPQGCARGGHPGTRVSDRPAHPRE